MAKTGQNSFCYTPGQSRFLKNGTPVFDPPCLQLLPSGAVYPMSPIFLIWEEAELVQRGLPLAG